MKTTITYVSYSELYLLVLTLVLLSSALAILQLHYYLLVSTAGFLIAGYVAGVLHSLRKLSKVLAEYPTDLRILEDETPVLSLAIRTPYLKLLKITKVDLACDVGMRINNYVVRYRDQVLETEISLSARVGTHRINTLILYFTVLGGLAEGLMTLEIFTEVCVLPKFSIGPIPYSVPGFRHLGTGPSKTRGPGTNIFEVREYMPGDEFKKIDWKATARLSRLAVKEFEKEMHRDVIISLILSDKFFYPESRALENLFQEVCKLASGLLSNGLHVRLLVVSERSFLLSNKVTSISKIGELLEVLSRIEWPERPLMTYSALRVASWLLLPVVVNTCSAPCVVVNIVCLEDLSDAEAALRVFKRLKALAHEAIFITITPALIDLRTKEITLGDLSNMYQEVENLIKLSKKIPNSIVSPDISAAALGKVLKLRATA
ncbi:MAG: DUF58 domain-containing protein [Desulfurococcaceae archaeon TW002]